MLKIKQRLINNKRKVNYVLEKLDNKYILYNNNSNNKYEISEKTIDKNKSEISKKKLLTIK